MPYHFDEIINRKGTNAIKWEDEFLIHIFGSEGLLPLWVADMDFRCPDEVVTAVTERAQHGIYGYSDADHAFYDILAQWALKRNQWHVESPWMVFVPGVVPAINYALQAFCEPGDEVIIQSPVYQMFEDVIKVQNMKLVNNALKYEAGKYVVDFEDLEEKAASSKAKILILCNPHNPVGRVWTMEELQKIGQICLKHNVFVISDEIHSDLILEGHKHIPFGSISDEFLMNSMTCISPTKTFNLAGLQISVSLFKDEAKKKRFKEVLHECAVMHPNPFGIVAWKSAYEHGETWLEELLKYIQGNFDYMHMFIQREMPIIKMVKPEGTYLAWLDFKGLKMDHKTLSNWLRKDLKLAMGDGFTYGPGGEGFVRVNVACSRNILTEALNRIKEGVASLA